MTEAFNDKLSRWLSGEPQRQALKQARAAKVEARIRAAVRETGRKRDAADRSAATRPTNDNRPRLIKRGSE